MKRINLTLALMIVAGVCAQAQFGNLGNKIKNKVKIKDKVESAVKDQAKAKAGATAKSVVGDQAAEAAGLSDEGSAEESGNYAHGFNYKTFWKKSFEPTAEALEADSWASNTTKLDYQTKTMKELHAAYDHLPEYYFPFHPYYKEENQAYYCFDGTSSVMLYARWMDFMKKCLKDPFAATYQSYDYFPLPGREIFVSLDYTFRSAFLADFVIDPHGSGPYSSFAHLLCFHHKYYCKTIEYHMDKPEEGLITKDWFIYKGSQQKYREWIQEGVELGENIATQVTPIAVVQNDIIGGFEKFNNAETSMIARLCGGIQALAGYDRILINHKDYNADDETNQKIKRLITLNSDKVRKMCVEFQIASKDPIDEPKGVNVDAVTKAKGTERAKSFVGVDKFEKIIFESSAWRAFKEHEWPYRIRNYVLPVAVVYKENGKRWVRFCDLGKSPDGGHYTIQASNTKDPDPIPLK